MSNYNTWLTLFSFVFFPLFLLFVAFFFIGATEALEKRLSDQNPFKKWLKKRANWRNPDWLRNRMDMIFSLLIVAVLIVITVIYS